MTRLLAPLVALLACAACGRSSTSGLPQGDAVAPSAHPEVERLAFVPESLALRAGVAGEARLFGQSPAGWEDLSTDPAIVYAVEGVELSFAPPLVTGALEGEGRITARLGALQASLPVTVGPPPVPVSLTIVPSPIGLLVGVPRSFAVILGYDDGRTRDVTASAGTRLQAWGNVGLSAELLLVGESPGVGELRAEVGELTAVAEARVYGRPELLGIAVVPPSAELEVGTMLQLRVEGALPDGLTADLTAEVAGTSYAVEGGVANHFGDGLVQGAAEGAGRVVARNQEFEAACALQVLPARTQPLVALRVEPAHLEGLEGDYLNVRVDALFGDGSTRPVTDDPLTTYRTDDDDVAFPASRGLLVLLGPGETTLHVSYSGAEAGIPVVVRQGQIRSAGVDPARLDLAPGEQGSFVMRAGYENGRQADISCQAHWSSADPAIASIDGCGVVTAHAVGTTVVTGLSPARDLEMGGLMVLVR